MAENRTEFIEKLLKGYSTYYDIERKTEAEQPLAATAFFHVRSSKYMLVQKAEIWAADNNEFLYIFSVPELTPEVFNACVKTAYEDGMPRIEPNSNHMSSYIEVIFAADRCTQEGAEVLRRYRCRKNFFFSLHGWMELFVTAADLGNSAVFSNKPNGQTAEYIDRLLHPEKNAVKKNRSWKMIKMLFR